ncbi:hypothetical protein [Streptomyces zaomyceticus]|uniref:hypothetical protein n=1 Tax=Streptomyces zaomyceticus TaxID=68286 RepID=UPI002F916DA4
MSPRTDPNSPDEGLAIGYQPSSFEADTRYLHRLYRALGHERNFLGFPDHLGRVMGEVGSLLGMFDAQGSNPYARNRFDTGTQDYEEEVLRYFAALAGASPGQAQGFVAASPHDALLGGLLSARGGLPEPSVYVSEQAHYEVVRAGERLGMYTVRVRALPDGTRDAEDLRLQSRLRRGAGALVVAACGTPLHGAIDDVADLYAAAGEFGPVHVPVDASAGGLAAAHSNEALSWSFAHGAHSLTLSGHSLLGLPVPAGISLVRRRQVAPTAPAPGMAVSGHLVVGSRGGLAVLLLWARLRSLGRAGVAAMVARCQDVAAYALEEFRAAGASPECFPGSLTVTFACPPVWVVDKWCLEVFGDRARITATGPMTHTAVAELAAGLSAARQGVAA